MLSLLNFIAQANTPESQPASSPFGSLLLPLLLMGFVIYFLMLRPQSKERKKRAEMLSAIKKNDRVVTVGGILGTVVSVKENEITLKVDESNNTKITFTRSAIQQGTGSEGGEYVQARSRLSRLADRFVVQPPRRHSLGNETEGDGVTTIRSPDQLPSTAAGRPIRFSIVPRRKSADRPHNRQLTS